MRIEAIIFDIGGVLLGPADAPMREKWASRCGLSPEAFDQIMYFSEWGEQALSGAYTHAEIWALLGEKLNVPAADLRELEADYWDGNWDSQILTYCRKLKMNYRLAVISDAYPGAREMVKPWVNDDLFELIVFSAEEKVRKPNPVIYQRTLARLGVAPEDALFIDDRLENIEGANAVGMHAIQYSRFSQFLADLEKYIGEV